MWCLTDICNLLLVPLTQRDKLHKNKVKNTKYSWLSSEDQEKKKIGKIKIIVNDQLREEANNFN